jgi:signal transduction histidine kinase
MSAGKTPYEIAEIVPEDRIDVSFGATGYELEVALHDAVLSLNSVACSKWVRIELVVAVPITGPVDPRTWRSALREIMLTAINAAPGGQVLVTAATYNRRLRICVTDDGPGTDQYDRETSVRGIEALVALPGGSIAVEARPGLGTSVTIRLPIPLPAEPEANGSERIPMLAEQAA